MGKQQKSFKPGDYVFAKVKGYPAWPAKIVSLNGKKYNIYFYGTGESGNLLANDIYDYFEHKQQFLAKVLKRRDYNDGLAEIETEVTQLNLTTNGEKPTNTTIDNASEADDTINKTDISMEVDTNQTVDTTVSDIDTSVADTSAPEPPVKIPKKRNADANSSITQPPAKTRRVEETCEPEKVSDEIPVTLIEQENSTVENEEESSIQENELEPASTVTDIVKEATQTPVPSRGRKPSAKTPQSTQKTPRRAVKQEVMSPVYEPHIPVPESVSRSGRKIKPKRYLDEETNDAAAANVQTPGKKIKNQPTTPITSAMEEDDVGVSSTEAAETLQPDSPTVPAPSEVAPKKGRKKSVKTYKSFTFVSKKELENMEEANLENGIPHPTNKDDLLVAILPSGKVIGIKVYKDWPESFSTPAVQAQWILTMNKNALHLKNDLENGRINPTAFSNQLETSLNLTPEEILVYKKEHETEIRQRKLRLLKLECSLVNIEKEIRIALNLDNPDIEQCIRLLDDLAEMELNRIIVLKQFGIVDLLNKIRNYIGNGSKWKLSEEEMEKFHSKADIIRNKAQLCLSKIMMLFDRKNETEFSGYITAMVALLKVHTSNLSADEFLEMVDEPSDMLQTYNVESSENPAKKKSDTEVHISNNKLDSKANVKSPSKKDIKTSSVS